MDELDLNTMPPVPSLLPESKTQKRFSPLLRQLFATSATILTAVSCGTIIGYTAILFPQLNETKQFEFDPEEESWIASLAALPMAPGCILGGIIMEVYGRKLVNILVCIPYILGWMLIYFANGLPMFLWGRLLQGISMGVCGPLNSVFIGETTEPKYRGMFLATVSSGYIFGILFSHALGTCLTWELTAIFCVLINILSLILFVFIPESPSYLLAKGKSNESYEAFCWLRGYGTEAVTEFQSMILNQKVKTEKKRNTLMNLKQPEFYKALFILLAMFFVLQFSGVNVITFYTVSIMEKSLGNILDKYIAVIIIDTVRLITGIATCVLMKSVQRRLLFISSGIGTGLCMIFVSIYLFLISKYPEFNNYSFIPLILIIGYICFTTIGLMPLPWCLIGELFPLCSRGIGSGISSACNFLFFFIVVKLAPGMFSTFTMEGSFLLYGIIALLGTNIAFFLPETKNKTLQEIENEFSKNKKPLKKCIDEA